MSIMKNQIVCGIIFEDKKKNELFMIFLKIYNNEKKTRQSANNDYYDYKK